MKTCVFSFMGNSYSIGYSGDKKTAIKNFEALLMSTKNDGDIFADFLNYGKKMSKYYAYKHDYDIDTGARFIASSLIMKYYEYLEYEQLEYDELNAINRLNAFNHVYGTIYASLAQLNYSKCGIYSRAHWSTDNTEYSPNKGAIYHDSKLTERPNLKGGKMIDVFDLLEQWENRQARTERKIAGYAIMGDAVKLADNADIYKTPWEKECDKHYEIKNDFSVTIADYVSAKKEGVYTTAEMETINRDNINSLYYIVTDIKQEKSFERVASILKSGVKNKTDEKFLERFRARHNLKGVTSDDLRAVFDIKKA